MAVEIGLNIQSEQMNWDEADFRQTKDIEKWWEIVWCLLTQFSLFADSGKLNLAQVFSGSRVRGLLEEHHNGIKELAGKIIFSN